MFKKILLATISIILFLNINIINAQDKIGTDITVSPIIDEFTIEPGEVISRIISVENTTSKDTIIYPIAVNFSTDNELGQPILFPVSDNNNSYALASWISFGEKTIHIPSREKINIQITISSPKNAEPGGHYGAVLFSTKNPENTEKEKDVGVVGLIGTLLLVTTPGDLNNNLLLKELSVPKLAITTPAKLSLLFENNGNVHQKPQGDIEIKNWAGDKIKTFSINNGGGNVLPESSRRFTNTWELSWKDFGIHTVTASIRYSNPELVLSAQQKIFIIPFWVVLLVIISIITGLFIYFRKSIFKFIKNLTTIKQMF